MYVLPLVNPVISSQPFMNPVTQQKLSVNAVFNPVVFLRFVLNHVLRHVSYQTLKDCITTYQKFVNNAKSHYFSNLSAMNANRAKVIFKTINSVLNPATCSAPLAISRPAHNFVQKVQDIRYHLSPPDMINSHQNTPSNFTSFKSMTTSQFRALISKMKFTYCHLQIAKCWAICLESGWRSLALPF